MPTYEEKVALTQRTAGIMSQPEVTQVLADVIESLRGDLRAGANFDSVMSTFAGCVITLAHLVERGETNLMGWLQLSAEEYERHLTDGTVQVYGRGDLTDDEKQALVEDTIANARRVQANRVEEINAAMAELAEQIAGPGPMVVSFVDGVPQWVRAGEKFDA